MEDALPLGRLALLLFTLMGPIGLIPLFDGATAARPAGERCKIALQVAAFAITALALAVFLGTAVMARVGTTPPSLIMAAGAILVLTALRNILGAGSQTVAPPAARPDDIPSWVPALTPIAIPGLVTPVVVAILVIFTSAFPANGERLAILGVAVAIMALNIAAMLLARVFMHRVGTAPLLLLGSVFGVLQVALGIEILTDGVTLALQLRADGA
jgi:multiple antibiotic resistance protein